MPAPRLRALGPGLACALAIATAGALARRHEEGLTEVRPGGRGESAGIDAVVPARDEAARIETCVRALTAAGQAASVTVVDDGSSDGTGALAAGSGARVLRVEGPPAGWLGKPHACAVGAAAGDREWLAFVDADVTLAPEALPALVRHAEASGAGAVSPLLRQDCGGGADGLLVPLAFWQYLVGLPGSPRRSRRGPPRAILNGQCIVVKRTAYRGSGGHGADSVRGSVVEDSALARRLAAAGHRVDLVRGPRLGSVRMYRGLGEVRAGFGKNIAAFLAADPGRGLLVATAGMSLAALPGLVVRAVRARSLSAALGAATAYATGVAVVLRPYRAAGRPAGLALAHPAAALAIQAIAIESLLRSALHRRPAWRGRRIG